MSATTATTMDSRSSSPETPETSDVPNNVTIHNELPSWYHPLPVNRNIGVWDGDPCQKSDNERMLQLDDIIQEHAYDDSACSGVQNPPSDIHPPLDATQPKLPSPEPLGTSLRRTVPESGLSIPALSQMHSTPIVPPPAMRTCRRDPASIPRRVVYPPKDSCYNLVILTPNIPESGAKSRVETQVRVTVDLAHASATIREKDQYDRVGSWKWLKLPPGTSTKRRARREGKIDPTPLDVLHLTATVTCASAPYNHVVSCGSCRNREAKRVARKLAARVRPARSDSDTPEDGYERQRSIKEDTTSIIQFNCPDVVDFSTGSAVLPVRITCYCRHHREKVGFNIHFTMVDNNGRLVGTGVTPPIMITDDHKSTVKSGTAPSTPGLETQVDWSGLPLAAPQTDTTSLLKHSSRNSKDRPKTRSKPYDATGRGNQSKFSREASVTSLSSSVNSPSTQPYAMPSTRSPTPPQPTQPSSPAPTPQHSATFLANRDSPSAFSSSEPVSASLNSIPSTTIFSPPNDIPTITASHFPSPSDVLPSNTPPVTQPSQLLATLVPPQPIPFLFFNPSSPPPASSLPLPRIHRLIPSSGPTHGGIEVTILGENFHPAIHLNCVFGDVVASSTQRWSDNTLLCVLPPRSSPGVVAVWFEGLNETKSSILPSLFTYTNESDRALMELALQVVGLKMTGKIEDAKNIALRIVGSTGTEGSPSGTSSSPSDMMQVAAASYKDMQPLSFLHLGHDHETTVIKFLSLIDIAVEKHHGMPPSLAVSHTTSSGQTLLHLAVLLKFTSLTEFLIAHGVDLDVRDRNGYTALHFAALVQSEECARLLVAGGADSEIVDSLGKTPQDIAPPHFFEGIIDHVTPEGDLTRSEDEDGESHLGDVESDEDMTTIVVRRRHTCRGTHRYPHRSRDGHEQFGRDCSPEPQPPQASDKDVTKQRVDTTSDEKQAASFVALIQRTLAQIPAPQGIIPTIPQLPLPHLPGMPTVPWGAIPQIPMVFPVFVPMPGWPSFLSDKRDGQRDDAPSGKEDDSREAGYSTAQELRATWDKLIAVAIATATLRPPPADEAPPMYTPRETRETTTQQHITDTVEFREHTSESAVAQASSLPDRPSRHVGYEDSSTLAPDANAYEYIPVKARAHKAKKHDRMLVLFWLPILLLSLLWAFHNCIRFVIHVVKTTVSLKAELRA